MELDIRINTDGYLADISSKLGDLWEKAPSVLKKAINDTAKKSGRELAGLAQTRYRVKTVKFAREFQYRYATKTSLEAVLIASGESLSTSKFKTIPSNPRYSEQGSPPVKVAVLVSTSPKVVTSPVSGLNAFLTRFQSGHVAVVQRQPNEEYSSRGWATREKRHQGYKDMTGKLDRSKIKEFYGPSIPTMLRKTGVSEGFIESTQPKILKYLDLAVQTHINRELHFAKDK